ncbi:MAG: hypothetical protein NZ530_03315 [Thermodesulfobacteriaceae bacterium]|nr:hypothetical protein [Thermodesulfobacteriaceae bacterium]MDW8135322.1 hypothetical protein [Thermodesulfobacterium sp.]
MKVKIKRGGYLKIKNLNPNFETFAHEVNYQVIKSQGIMSYAEVEVYFFEEK